MTVEQLNILLKVGQTSFTGSGSLIDAGAINPVFVISAILFNLLITAIYIVQRRNRVDYSLGSIHPSTANQWTGYNPRCILRRGFC
jgi:hypothetical protein